MRGTRSGNCWVGSLGKILHKRGTWLACIFFFYFSLQVLTSLLGPGLWPRSWEVSCLVIRKTKTTQWRWWRKSKYKLASLMALLNCLTTLRPLISRLRAVWEECNLFWLSQCGQASMTRSWTWSQSKPQHTLTQQQARLAWFFTSSVCVYFLDCQNLTAYCIALKVIFKRLVYSNVYSQLCGHIPRNND